MVITPLPTFSSGIMRVAAAALLGLLAAGCQSGKPAHYYVLCEGKDYNGWNLVDTEYENGYLMACTYQSPNKQQSYTARCRDSGCD